MGKVEQPIGPEKSLREDGQPVPSSLNQQRASLVKLLFGSEHRYTLYLAGFGELFAFSLGERFVNEGPAILRQVQRPNPALALERRDDQACGAFRTVVNGRHACKERLAVAHRLNERRTVE